MRALLPAACLLVACTASPPPMLPIVATPPAQLPALADIARACAFEVSCFNGPIASSIDECAVYLLSGLDYWIDPSTFVILGTSPAEFARWVDCSNRGSDCASVLDCVSRGHGADYCSAHPGNSCDGSLLVQCVEASDPALFTTDCAALGMRCAEANGSASCTDGAACAPKSSSSCDGNRYYEYCASTGLRYRLDCTLWSIPDATCRGDFDCVPSGPPCAGARCDGDVRVTCLFGQEVRDDCTQLASTCTIVNGAPKCVAVANGCGSATDAACVGNSIVMCISGIPETIDCSAIGRSTCMTNSGGDGPLCN